MPAVPSWLTKPLSDQLAALVPPRRTYDPTHPLRCHRRRVSDRIVFDKLVQVLRFRVLVDASSAITLRQRRDEWIARRTRGRTSIQRRLTPLGKGDPGQGG